MTCLRLRKILQPEMASQILPCISPPPSGGGFENGRFRRLEVLQVRSAPKARWSVCCKRCGLFAVARKADFEQVQLPLVLLF